MHFFKIRILLFAMAVLAFISQSCTQQSSTADKKKVFIDSLEKRVTLIDGALNAINAQDLQNRIALINTWYITLKDTTYDVAKKMQVDFNGFKVVYQKYIDNYFAYEAENEVLKEQVKSFKSASKEASKKEFKQQYYILKQQADTLYGKVVRLTQPVNDLAFSWRRYKNQME